MKNVSIQDLATQAAAKIAEYKTNKIISDFVLNQALEQTAADIRAKTKSGTTSKAVDLLRIKNKKVAARVDSYIEAGFYGVFMASIG